MKTASLTMKDVYLLPRHELSCLSRFDPASNHVAPSHCQLVHHKNKHSEVKAD